MNYHQFDVIITKFPFVDHEGVAKVRPAVIISNNDYNEKTNFVIAAMITTAKDSDFWGDIEVKDRGSDSLNSKSIVRMKLSTLVKDKIIKKIGKLNWQDQKNLEKKLKSIF